ncbi:uncharacterized protein LOC106722341 [Alligator sinensis]|uniref:Uncharacterized protein LOC106722341 n=1 Tax=Alligator sinensis TaxID=38654 RepID=A0A3Q0GVD4_ALLSI|nr:uncharacterized protein LOC106722341 [Alligator sinensis]
MLTDKIVCGGDRTMWSKPDCQRLLSQIDAASNKMSSAIVKESHRLKAWGVLGEGTGAHLVNKDKTRLLTKEELMGPDGSMRALDAVCVDPTTGLLTPDPECVMLLANHCLVPVSRDLFLHPETGKVLPVAGNIGYDPISSKVVCTVDSTSDELHKSGAPIFPYVPYPICPSTGLPVKTNLPVLHPEKVFKLGGLMRDPATEIEVPVLAVTIHPQTRQKLSLGGTYLNPLTGTVTPLQLGGPMNEPKGGKIVPILGVHVDSNTGDVIPVGGLMGPSESPILLGDSFSEPLSGKSAHVHGAFLQQDTVLPHAGGYRALLEASMLVAQMHVVKTLRQYQDSICEDLSVTVDRQRVLKAAIEDMKKTLSIRLHRDMHWLQSLETQRDIASSLKSNGGKLGMIKYPGTEMWIPAVFGVTIPDPGGSGLMVPVLGIEPDWNTGLPAPLAGTMEDADGKGLVPITVGARTIDPVTGKPGPVIGVRTNPWTNTVVPIVQSLGALPRGAADPDLLNLLENEINSRQNYWHCQRKKEEYLQKELNFVFLDILDAVEEGKVKKIRYKEKLKDIEEMCHFLEESSLQEAQRRTARDLSSLLGLELSLQWKVNRDEREQEVKLLLVIRKMLEKLLEFIKKMQLAESRVQIQLKEKEQQRSKSPNAETAMSLRPRKATLHLLAEFQEHIKKQQGSVEFAYGRLEYLRELSNIQALQAKARLSGTPQCFESYPGTRFYSFAGVPQGASEVIHQKLIPLLKSLIQTLGESKRSPMSPEMLVLGSDKGYCSQSTLKASTAHSEAFLACSGPEVTPPTLLSPLQPSSSPSKIPHIQQEVQTRFFLEKHASELVHLELSLMTEEINTICSFYESSKALEKEEHKESRNVKSNKEMAMGRKWDTLLQDLAECHQEAEQTLCQKHWEDIKNSGLSLDVGTPKDSLHFLEEIPHHFSLLDPGSRISDSHIRSDVAKEQEAAYSLEEKLFPDSTTQILQASAVKIVKLEAMKQVCLYRVLDLYNALQRQVCPEGVSRILNQLEYRAAGEAVAQEVAQAVEKQQVTRAMAFLQKHHQERDLLIGLKEESEGKLRHLQKQFQMELQMQTEEKLQTKEMQVIHKAERQELRNHVEHLIYFILSQRHLRQTVIMLQDCFRLQTMNERTQSEDGHLEELAIEEPLLDDDLKSILHLMKDHTEHRSSVLELKLAAKLLQLREKQYREVARGLKDHSLDKAVDDANTATDGLREFREQTIRRLTEQLKIAMGNRRTRENTPSLLHPVQIKKPTLEAENKRGKREERWEIFQEKQLELEESDRWQISDEGAKLQDQLERGDLKSWMMHKLVKEHNDTTAFSEKAFQQDLEKLRMRPEQEENEKEGKQPEKDPSSSSSTSSHTQEKPSQACDQVVALFAESIKILKQTEKVMASRISLLNPQFLCDPNKGKHLNTSPLLTLLRDVNDQLQTHAKAAGLLESQQEKGTGSSFRDISDVLMTHKGKLKPVHPEALSAREFVIYQYGISILQFLRLHINAPEINLCIATSIPRSNAVGNAFQNSFFYQNFEKKLFVLRECLGSVGSFLLLLVHCLAHITAADLSQDSSPAFLRLFYQALKACLSETFSLRLRMSALLQDNKSSERISEILLKGEPLVEGNINLLSQLFDAKVESSTETETSEECKRNLLLHANLEDLLKNTLSGKKREHFIPSSADCEEKSTAGRTSLREENCSSFSPAEMEEKLDALTEELVKIMEEEHHYLSSAANDDLPFDHLEIIGLEKDCLVKQIEMLEGKIAEGRGGLW